MKEFQVQYFVYVEKFLKKFKRGWVKYVVYKLILGPMWGKSIDELFPSVAMKDIIVWTRCGTNCFNGDFSQWRRNGLKVNPISGKFNWCPAKIVSVSFTWLFRRWNLTSKLINLTDSRFWLAVWCVSRPVWRKMYNWVPDLWCMHGGVLGCSKVWHLPAFCKHLGARR